jgi:flavin reductase (DIM6/NTAB) family NADH-FMN oxidoreductase RutF
MAIDAKNFWRAIGHRAIGSTVVTARSAEGPAGFLGLSATHVSADPPLMLVSIDRRTSALQTILAARHFAINYLPRDAIEVAETFAGRRAASGAARFVPDAWDELETGAPVLRGALGALDCVLEETLERHGTVLAIGRVVAVRHGEGGEPLIHFRNGWLEPR